MSSTATSNLELVRGAYEAFATGDVPSVLAISDPNIEWIEAEGFPTAGTHRGHDGMVNGVFVPLMSAWDGLRIEPHEFIDGGDTVVSLGRYSGTYKATGKAMSAAFAHVWDLNGGKVIRFRQYVDSALVQAAMQP